MKQKLKKQDVGFAQIKNEVLNDRNLSWKAKGLFAYLYSKPDDWDYSGDRIANDGRDGRKSVYKALKELEKQGYLRRERFRTGKMGYRIYYQPSAQIREENEKPDDHFGQEPNRQQAKMGSISNTEINTNREKESNTERGETSSPSLRVSKIISEDGSLPYLGAPIDYFSSEAKRRHQLRYLQSELDRDSKIKRRVEIAVSRLGKEMESFIDWWFSGAGQWADYVPEACFSNETYRRYENREVIARIQKKRKGREVIEG